MEAQKTNKSKAERTREFIIERSAPLFNQKGYASTSLTDIMDATGLTKGAIYGNFSNKDEVAVAVYHYHMDNLIQKLSAAMSGQPTAADQLLAFTGFYRTNWKKIFEKGGCPLQNASVEADDSVSYLKPHVQETVKKWARSFTRIIERGQENGEFKKNIDAKTYAYTLLALMEGGIMLGKIMNNHKLLYTALDKIDEMVTKELKK